MIEKQMSPYVFAGLPDESKSNIVEVEIVKDEGVYYKNKFQRVLNKVNELTGYTATQIKQEKKGKIGLTTVRQVLILLSIEEGISPTMVGRFIKRHHSDVLYTNTTVRDRINCSGYELLTTLYNQIKSEL